MSIPFLIRRRPQAKTIEYSKASGHRIESGFDASVCRFHSVCACGAEFETRYIDEALEWSEMHLELAPLADQLGAQE